MALNASDKLAVEFTDTLLDVTRFTRTIQRRALSMLRLLEDDLVEAIHRFDIEGVTRVASRRARTEALIRNVRATIRKRYGQAEARTTTELRELSVLSHQQAVANINQVFTVNIVRTTITQADLKAMVDRTVVMGEPAVEHWKGQTEATRRRFAREMRLGQIAGETNQQLIQRVRGRATGRTIGIELASGKTRRVRQFAGGIMDVSTRDAASLVRTSAQSVSNNAILRTYRENEDIVRGVEALTTLDGRTSDICMRRTGGAWDLQGDPLPESSVAEPFPGPPPWHWNCRTSLVPLTKSWEDIFEESTGKRRKLLETVPNSVRTSIDGLVGKEVRTFDDFLRVKGDAFARRKLGPARFDLWKDGKITTQQLTNNLGKSRTVRQLETVARP